MTKPVTAVALMMLYEEARLHLDDPVEAYLPEFKNRQLLISGATSLDQTVPIKTKITIHHLLTHTSGLSLFTNPGLLGEAYAKEKTRPRPRLRWARQNGAQDRRAAIGMGAGHEMAI